MLWKKITAKAVDWSTDHFGHVTNESILMMKYSNDTTKCQMSTKNTTEELTGFGDLKKLGNY